MIVRAGRTAGEAAPSGERRRLRGYPRIVAGRTGAGPAVGADAQPPRGRGQRQHRRPPSIARVSTVVVTRPPRRPAPDVPTGDVFLDPPPAVDPTGASRWEHLFH